MLEQAYILAPGLLKTGQQFTAGAAFYTRAIQQLSLRTMDGHAVAADVTARLTVAGTAVGPVLTISATAKKIDFDLAPVPVGCNAGQDIGLVIVADGGERDLILVASSIAIVPASDPNWVVVTAGDLQSRLSAPNYAALTSDVLRGTQADPVPQILSDITQTVRSLASRRSALGPDGTIPSSFKVYLLSLAKDELFGRVPQLKSLRAELKDEVALANKRLDMLAKGDWPIEPPVNPLATQPVGGAAWNSESRIDL